MSDRYVFRKKPEFITLRLGRGKDLPLKIARDAGRAFGIQQFADTFKVSTPLFALASH